MVFSTRYQNKSCMNDGFSINIAVSPAGRPMTAGEEYLRAFGWCKKQKTFCDKQKESGLYDV